MKKKTLSDRIIVSTNVDNNFFCKRCEKGHNELIIFEGEGYCRGCSVGDLGKLPVFNQINEKIK